MGDRHKEQVEYVEMHSADHITKLIQGWRQLRVLDNPDGGLIAVMKRPEEPTDGHKT